ncbi:MAG TPA: ATP-binding protein [Kofleriaceae bacterium]|nr:ATP-binding protein [Kofleriaceae bacterium]
MRRQLLFIAAVLVAALAALVVVGSRVLDRDRDRLYERYARERLHILEEAGRVFERDVQGVIEDLDLAATLLDHADADLPAERELHAIATIKREYMMIETRRMGVPGIRVVAPDAPATIAERAGPTSAELLSRALREPDKLQVSDALGAGDDPASWYRVFARWSPAHRDAIAVVVDARLLLWHLDILRDRSSSLFIVGGDHRTTLRGQHLPVPLHRLVDRSRAIGSAVAVLEESEGVRHDLPQDAPVAVATTMRIGNVGEPWTLVRVSSAASLEAQEKTLVRRLVVGGALALGLLLASAAYVLHNTRRTTALRERLRHADRLAHLTEKAEKILDHIPSGVLALGDDQRITATNHWIEARLPRPVQGATLAEAFAHAPAAHVERVTALVAEARAAGAARTLHRQRLALLGADALVNVHAVPLERAVADASALVVIDDLTALARIEERLLRTEKLATAGQLAAGIAHEIGTPLGIARGRAELALARLGSDHAQAPAQQVIIDEVDRVTRLIRQLLDYVRPAPAEARAVDVAAAIERVASLLGPKAGERGVLLAPGAPGDLPAVHADPDHVQQILVNLTMNALDACPRGGRVELRARATPRREVVIEVADDGPGIPPELRAHVFDPFFTTKKRGQGTGLGLWIVAQLVRSNGAEIELAEAIETVSGTGTVVRITWPPAAPDAAERTTA